MRESKPVIGIPSWKWKQELLRYAQKHPHIIKMSPKLLCHECSRHFEILRMFDSVNTDYKNTEYYKFAINNNRKEKSILKRIGKFRNLYDSIKNGGCNVPPIITDDGCRLDGSHRSSIIIHIGTARTRVNMVRYEQLFNNDKSAKIRKQVLEYRKRVYNL